MSAFPTPSQAKTFLIELGKKLAGLKLAPATSGNYSLRLSEQAFLITASGRRKGALTSDDFVTIDLECLSNSSGVTASSDTQLHQQIYRTFPNTRWVIHLHSIASTVLTHRIQNKYLTLTGYELLKVFPNVSGTEKEYVIPIFEGEEREDLKTQFKDYYTQILNPPLPLYLLRGHGLFLWGDHQKDVDNQLEAIDFMLECELYK